MINHPPVFTDCYESEPEQVIWTDFEVQWRPIFGRDVNDVIMQMRTRDGKLETNRYINEVH